MISVTKENGTAFPIRYMIALLGHCGILVAYAMRVNISVGLVAMVNSTYIQETSHEKMDPECRRMGVNSTDSSKVICCICPVCKVWHVHTQDFLDVCPVHTKTRLHTYNGCQDVVAW